MGSAEKFCLRWNFFESSVLSSFRDLRIKQDFFDVSLAVEDDHVLQAHKVILAACSPFFQNILAKQNMRQGPYGNPHPVIYLRGIKLQDLQYVLDFMYHGEVNVDQDHLKSFLAVAEDLQVKGLTQDDNQQGASSSNSFVKPMKELPKMSDPLDRIQCSNSPPMKKFRAIAPKILPPSVVHNNEEVASSSKSIVKPIKELTKQDNSLDQGQDSNGLSMKKSKVITPNILSSLLTRAPTAKPIMDNEEMEDVTNVKKEPSGLAPETIQDDIHTEESSYGEGAEEYGEEEDYQQYEEEECGDGESQTSGESKGWTQEWDGLEIRDHVWCCLYCDRKFSIRRGSNAKRHVLTTHSTDRVVCVACKKVLKNNHSLHIHLRKVHNLKIRIQDVKAYTFIG